MEIVQQSQQLKDLFSKLDVYLQTYGRSSVKTKTLCTKYKCSQQEIVDCLTLNNRQQNLVDKNQTLNNYYKLESTKQPTVIKTQKSKQKTLDNILVVQEVSKRDIQTFSQINTQISQITEKLDKDLQKRMSKEEFKNNEDPIELEDKVPFVNSIDIQEQQKIMDLYRQILYKDDSTNDWISGFKQDVEFCVTQSANGLYYNKFKYFLEDPELNQVLFVNKIFGVIHICLQLLEQQKTEQQYRDAVFHNNLRKIMTGMTQELQQKSIVDNVIQILKNTIN